MSATERLQLLITANGTQAISELGKVGKAAKSDLGSAERSIDGLSNKMVGFGAASLAGGAVAARGLYSAAEAAQGLADSVDKADATFGSSTQLNGFADRAAKSMGLSKEAALDAASAYGLLLQQAGLGGAGLADTSAQLAQRTADLAERFKKPYEEVQKAIENVIKTGSNKSLKGLLGIDVQIDPADLKGLDTAAKTTKIYQEILRQTADSAGFFASSTDDMGVRFAQVQAEMKNAQAEFGEAALPAITKVLEAGSALLDMFNTLPGPVKELVGTLATLGTVGALAGGGLSLIGGGFLKLVPGLKAGVTAFREGEGAAGKLTGALGAFNPAALAATAAIGAGLGIYEAWASSANRVKGEIEELSATITNISDRAQVLPALAQQFNDILESRGGGADAFLKTGLAVTDVVNAVNAAPGSFDKFRDSVDGVAGPLENLERLGPLLTGGIDAVAEAAQSAPPAVRALIENLIGLYKAELLTGDEFKNVINYIVDLDKAAAGSSNGVKFQAEQLFNIVPAAQQAGEALALYREATDDTAGVDRQAAALAKLKTLFPEAATAAGIVATGIGAVGTESDIAAGKVDKFSLALEGIASGAPDALGAYADAMAGAGSAVDSVANANDRLAAANKKLADLTNRDTAAISSAYDRIIDAKQRLDDILAGDGNNLEQESAESQIARARANLAEANARLAENPQDSRAQTAKDEALADIERAISRRQELKRSADDTARQIRDAQKNIADAQEAYNEATQAATPEAIASAKAEVAKAEEERITALARFGAGVENGTVSVEAYKAELDRQVALGIISPEAADTLKGEMDEVATQAGLAAAALGTLSTLANSVDPTAWFRGVFEGSGAGGSAAGGSALGNIARRAIERAGKGLGAGQGVSSRNAEDGYRNGLPDDPTSLGNRTALDNNGIAWRWDNAAKLWKRVDQRTAGRASGGPVTAGMTYRVNEAGQEFFTPDVSGYVINAKGTAAMSNGNTTSAQPTSINAPITITEAYHPRETASLVVRKLRSKQFLAGG